MTTVRPFTREDVPGVAALQSRVFGPLGALSGASLERYLEDFFFGHPWVDEELPSLVCEEGEDRIVGFLGVLPRPMTYKGQRLRAVVSTKYMVDAEARTSMAALRLLKTFLAGPQDLSLADAATPTSQRIWEGLGGEASPLYSACWLRPLRPSHYLRVALSGQGLLAGAAAPLGVAADAAFSREWRSAPRAEGRARVAEPLTPALFLEHFPRFSQGRSLRPDPDAEGLRWLFAQLSNRPAHGVVRSALVRGASDEVVGWFVYYVNPGKESEVLQLAATDQTLGTVLDVLFADAWGHGSAALFGRLDARALETLAHKQWFLLRYGQSMLVHARRPELVNAVHRGDAFLSRLEGEWWVRYRSASPARARRDSGGPCAT